MSSWKRILIIKLVFKLILLSLIAPLNALSQALPAPQPEKVSRAVSGVLQGAMRNRGFASNDPRFWQTLARVGGTATAVGAGAGVAAVTLGAVTAPAWVSIAAGAAVGAIVTYAVMLAADGLVEWLFNEDGTIDFYAEGRYEGLDSFSQGELVWKASSVGQDVYGTDPVSVANQARMIWVEDQVARGYPVSFSPRTCSQTSDSMYSCSGNILVLKTAAPIQCPTGTMVIGNVCAVPTFPNGTSEPLEQDGVSVQTAVDAIPDEDLNKPLNPALLAALTNQLWQQAASQPGYDGLPYPQNDPITAPEVLPWVQANPELAPTVADFVAPNPITPASPAPWVLPANPTDPVTTPATPVNPSVTNPASENPLTNLGPDPGIGAPTLEAIPTAQDILDPILDMLPGHQNFTAASHDGICPTPSFTLYGTHTLTAHCTLIEENKSVIQGVMTFGWAVLALFIVLSA